MRSLGVVALRPVFLNSELSTTEHLNLRKEVIIEYYIGFMLGMLFMRCLHLIWLGVLLLGACSKWSMTPYQLEIQQGSVIDNTMLNQIKVGMTQAEVRQILGTPPVADAFHSNEWDYVYFIRKKGVVSKPYHLAIFFDGAKIAKLTSDYPSEIPASELPSKDLMATSVPTAPGSSPGGTP